jgi:hypothetical protein
MASTETKICQNCKVSFPIDASDFDFYKKIDVPSPTWCVGCRMQRRMSWAADSTTLYHRTCQAPEHSEKIISVYPDVTKSPVYCPASWSSDSWDPMSYGREYDFSRPFFLQLKELLDVVPVRSIELVNSVNSDYCPGATDCKNCYLCNGTFGSENCLYGHTTVFSKECVDTTLSTFVQQAYDTVSVDKSFQVTSSIYSDELVDCDFMYDSRGCTDCLGCIGLRNKKYCIFNEQYSKEEYKKERAKYDLGSYRVRREVEKRFNELILKYPRKYAVIRNAPNCTGDNLINVKNCKMVFQAFDNIENVKNGFVVGYGTKDSQDIAGAGLKCELLYDDISIVGSSDVAFSYRVRNSHNVRYSRECFDSDHLFACVGLRSKKYCIFNRQYSKEEYVELIKKIREQMATMPFVDSKGRTYGYGEFLPPELSLFPYNSSWANDYFRETRESAERQGYWWYSVPVSQHAERISSNEIPDHCKDAPVSLTEKIIECMKEIDPSRECSGVFRIIPRELEFYKKLNIALPHSCIICRWRKHLKHFAPYKLWHRQCECAGVKQRTGYENTGNHSHGDARCPNEFETAYEPGRPEMLYCEQCYNKEIL